MTGGVRDKGRGDSSLRMTNTPNLHSIEIDGDRKSKILEITNKVSGLGGSLRVVYIDTTI